jgi:hypothetical protein
MAYDSAAVAGALVGVLENLSGLAVAQLGAPQAVGPRVSAWVTLGSQEVIRKAAGVTQRQARFMVMFCYRVDGAESDAEEALMDLVDAFMEALADDLTLGGTALALEFSSQAADEPDYQLRAGKEFREYPVVVTAVQRSGYEVTP